jgi:hypothetical protein
MVVTAPRHIATADLRPADLPGQAAGVQEIFAFAHTFDGYIHWGSFERCAEIANSRDHSTLDSLRTCLFFEARRWRHFDEEPDAEALAYWRELLEMIRLRLSDRELG